MAQRYGESFQRPMDPYTGLPDQMMPEMVRLNTTRPGGSGIVVLRDPDAPPPSDSSMGSNSPTGR